MTNSLQRIINTLESGRVVRYHAVPTVAPQLVAHHSWGVAIIALYITEGRATRELLTECLMHDTAEFFTGDVPFTVKRDNTDIKDRFDALESEYRRTELICDVQGLTLRDAAILKFCDTLEGFIWCMKTEQSGPVCTRWVTAYMRAVDKFSPVLTTAEMRRAADLFESYHGQRPTKF